MERHEMVFLSLLSGAFVCNWKHQSAHWKWKYFPLGCRQIQIYRGEKTIRKHINNVFAEDELDRENNTQKMRVDGVRGSIIYIDLVFHDD